MQLSPPHDQAQKVNPQAQTKQTAWAQQTAQDICRAWKSNLRLYQIKEEKQAQGSPPQQSHSQPPRVSPPQPTHQGPPPPQPSQVQHILNIILRQIEEVDQAHAYTKTNQGQPLPVKEVLWRG